MVPLLSLTTVYPSHLGPQSHHDDVVPGGTGAHDGSGDPPVLRVSLQERIVDLMTIKLTEPADR